ncbi:MAG TPA: ester cyclase [Ktedonobacteraceae bacterium]|jgi:predicted ester cyclase|nr:ester cyclase [Ktedonobacteraceae bacterium]
MSSSLTPDQRKALVREYLEHAWNTQEVEEREDMAGSRKRQQVTGDTGAEYSPDSVYLGGERLCIPLAQLRNVVRATFPDIRLTISDLVVDGEKVVVRWVLQGTDLGGYEGHAPTGRPIHMTGITIMRMEQETIVEEWNEVDIAGMLRQLGFVYVPQPPRITMRRPGPAKTSQS